MSTPAAHTAEGHAPAPQSEATPLRFVTAASLFDGHDAAINIMRRLIQAQGAEVIHLGHNRSVEDVVRAALQEDADAIALSSYQGGHVEYFKYMVDMLKERGAGHIRVFAGGGGTITPEEIRELEAYGVERIYHPNDGMHMGLVAMIEDVVRRAEAARQNRGQSRLSGSNATTELRVGKVDSDPGFEIEIGRMLSAIEEQALDEATLAHLRKEWQLAGGKTPVVGITGTGGAGKSSVTDELLNRFLSNFPDMHIAVISVDPTRRRTGGALLGDRIRMNSLRSKRVFMRSMATRRQHMATNVVLKDCISFLKSLGYDLVIVETAGIGQSDSSIVDLVVRVKAKPMAAEVNEAVRRAAAGSLASIVEYSEVPLVSTDIAHFSGAPAPAGLSKVQGSGGLWVKRTGCLSSSGEVTRSRSLSPPVVGGSAPAVRFGSFMGAASRRDCDARATPLNRAGPNRSWMR